MTLGNALLGAFLAACAACDIHGRRIPNTLIGLGAATGLGLAFVQTGFTGVQSSLLGLGTGLLLFLPLFVLRAMGAGDVKMLAAIGTFTGPLGALQCGLYAMIAGGLLSIAVLFGRGRWRVAGKNLRTMLGSAAGGPDSGVPAAAASATQPTTAARLPYAVAIAAGTLVWMILKVRAA